MANSAAGKSVIISVGGEKGAVSVSDDASAKNFADSLGKLMDEYGFDGVDIDLENGLDSTYMTKALKAVHAQHSGVVVTMAPQTIDMQSPQNAYFKTALNIKDFLTVVNTRARPAVTNLAYAAQQTTGRAVPGAPRDRLASQGLCAPSALAVTASAERTPPAPGPACCRSRSSWGWCRSAGRS